MKKNKNFLDIYHHSFGNERRREIFHEVLDRGAFLPKTVLYEDIDAAFKEWAKTSVKIVSDDGVEFPTMTLFSSQRFSEYSQTWEYVDDNNNLLLNFKTITRENNPQKGEIHGSIWNIPGDIFFTMKKNVVLDDNGSESFIVMKMKMPTAVDVIYELSIFTNKYEKLNEFNTIINHLFNARQCYIAPNGHYMPMQLEEISDTTEYSIDDRQFYGQTVKIRVKAYLITKDDYRIEERPMKYGANLSTWGIKNHRRRGNVEIEEVEDEPCNFIDEDNRYYYKQVALIINFPLCVRDTVFTIDEDFVITGFENENVRKIKSASVNNEPVDNFSEGFRMFENDKIKIKIDTKNSVEGAVLRINGYDPTVVYDSEKDNMESVLDENKVEEKEYYTIENGLDIS